METLTDWCINNMDEKQEIVPVISDVPLGSLISPAFFIIYANDLTKWVKECEAYGHADDFMLLTNQPQIYHCIMKT